MESIKVHVAQDHFAIICCPYCGSSKRVSIEKIKGKKHKILTKCSCEKRFEVNS